VAAERTHPNGNGNLRGACTDMWFRSHPVTAADTRGSQSAARTTHRAASIPSAMVTTGLRDTEAHPRRGFHR
jgi:hypothetical protein